MAELFGGGPPIVDRIMKRLDEMEQAHREHQNSWFYRNRHLWPFFSLATVIAGVMLGATVGYTIQSETVKANKEGVSRNEAILRQHEESIHEIASFIEAQKIINTAIPEMRSQINDIHKYLMQDKLK